MNMMSRRVLLAGAALVIHLPVRAFAHDDKDHITHLLKAMFDTPENPLSVDPVVVRETTPSPDGCRATGEAEPCYGA